MLQQILDWVSNNYIELSATVFGLLYILLSIKQSIWCWPAGLISSALLVYVFLNAKIYADMGLQVYYVIVSIYGWYYWRYGSKSKKIDDLKIAKLDLKLALVLTMVTALLFAFIAFILINFTDSNIPYWDAFTTAASFVATWMLAKKYIEHWLIWIVVDAISIALYFYKETYGALVLMLVYTVLAVVGYIEWKKKLKCQ